MRRACLLGQVRVLLLLLGRRLDGLGGLDGLVGLVRLVRLVRLVHLVHRGLLGLLLLARWLGQRGVLRLVRLNLACVTCRILLLHLLVRLAVGGRHRLPAQCNRLLLLLLSTPGMFLALLYREEGDRRARLLAAPRLLPLPLFLTVHLDPESLVQRRPIKHDEQALRVAEVDDSAQVRLSRAVLLLAAHDDSPPDAKPLSLGEEASGEVGTFFLRCKSTTGAA